MMRRLLSSEVWDLRISVWRFGVDSSFLDFGGFSCRFRLDVLCSEVFHSRLLFLRDDEFGNF